MKKLLLGLVFFLLFIPLIQWNIQLFEEEPLGGEYTVAEEPELNWSNWLTGSYQEQFSSFFNDTIGFKKTLVRTYNQYCFSLFNKANSVNTIIGKDKVLFQENVIESYLGKNFAGEDKLNKIVDDFKSAQIDLEKRGILLVAVIAPGKASFLKEYIPTRFDLSQKKTNNYDYLTKRLIEKDANIVDLSELLRNTKTEYPLFPKNGMHWSGYSTILTFNSLTRFIEEKTKKNLRGYIQKPGVLTKDSLRYTDNDIAKAMNTLWLPENFLMNYPVIEFEEDKYYKPNVLIIGDSYSQSFYGFYPFYENVFNSESSFWYYNRIELWPYESGKETNVHKLDKKEEILSRNVILLMATEDNLHRFGFGFLEDYKYILEGVESPKDKEIKRLEESIRNNPEWMKFIYIQAKERNQTVDQTVRANAIHLFNNKK